ncbi:MAG: hypothetical protein AAB327_03430 [Actinomycetota bacterium]
MKPADKSRIGMVPDIFGLLLQVLLVAVSVFWVIAAYLVGLPTIFIVGYWLSLIHPVLGLLRTIIQRRV